MLLLKEHCIVPTPDESISIYIMEKPNVNILSDANVTKDGIHIFISLTVDRDTQKKIRERMLTILPNSMWKDLPITNTWKDVLDEGITKGKTNWTLYGSRKPGHEAYQQLTHSYTFSFANDEEFQTIHLDFTQQEYFNTLLSGQGLSVQSTYVKHAESKGDKNTIIAGFAEQAKLPPKKRNADEIDDSSSSSSSQKVMRTEPTLDAARLAEYQKLEYFFKNGFSSANYNHEDMCKIGYGIQAMFGIENGLSLYLSVAKKYSSNMDWEDEYTKKFQKHLKPKHDWNMGFFMNLFQRVNKVGAIPKNEQRIYRKEKTRFVGPKRRRHI
jgi:hypothetical protein